MNKTKKTHSIHSAFYQRVLSFLHLIHDQGGINLKFHGDTEQIKDADILLFNHFSRFETVVPAYMVHRFSGQECRSIAFHGLFKAHPALTKFLNNMGAVPNDMPGLLPFMAAEILRGRKVVIFPEGQIVKDRNVFEKGKFGFYKQGGEDRIPVHRGAAALASILDLFKLRLQELFEANDEQRLQHWATSLGIPREDLRKAAEKPTQILPTTFTFYPLRVGENKLVNLYNRFMKKKSAQAVEELTIEGNILLKKTDMDVQVGTMFHISRHWKPWQKVAMRRYFGGVKKLDDLFDAQNTANTLYLKAFEWCLKERTNEIRDTYSKALYEGIRVHLHHVASHVVMQLAKAGITDITKAELHQRVFIAVQEVLGEAKIHFHRSLLQQDLLKGVLDGTHKDWKLFLKLGQQTQLITAQGETYQLSPQLLKTPDYHALRLENPFLVYVNESAPILPVAAAVKRAVTQSLTPQSLATVQWKIEQHAYTRALQTYAEEKKPLPVAEVAEASAKPYLLQGKGNKKKTGVLLVHGLLGGPAQLADFGKTLHEQGYTVLGCRLSGHGTSPWDLREKNYQDWVHDVERNYEILSAYCEQIVVVGFSTGAALSLNLASFHPQKLAGVVSVAAPLAIRSGPTKFVPWVNRLNKITNTLYGAEVQPFYTYKGSALTYRNVPMGTIQTLLDFMATLPKRLQKIVCPVLLLQGDNDQVVAPESGAKILAKLVKSRRRELHLIHTAHHNLIQDNIAESHTYVFNFIEEVTS